MPITDPTAVVIVDFQNEWTIRDSPFFLGRVSLAAEKCRTLVHEAHQRNLPIFYTKRYMEDRPDAAFNEYNERSDITDEMPVEEDISVMERYSWDPFYQTMLEEMLWDSGAEHLVIAGLAVNAGVRSCVEAAYDRGFSITLMEDGCSAVDPKTMQFTLEDLQEYRDIQVDILKNFRSYL